MKGVWQWKEAVKEKLKEKKEAYIVFMNNEIHEEKEISRVRYKAAKTVERKAVVVAKRMAYNRLYQKLETKEREKEIFKLAKASER